MNKTKLLSLILGIIMLLSTGCADAPADSNVSETVRDADTSSAPTTYAAWLQKRLDSFIETDVSADGNKIVCGDGTIVLASGDTNSLGVDVTGLRNEGYIIRTVGNDTVIVAKTDDGLDRGVRKYAAEFEQTGSAAVNHTDGLKIGKITLGGADITSYKILLPQAAEGDTTFAASATVAMETAAGELQKYIQLATGATLPSEYVVGLNTMTDDEIKAACGNAIVLLSDPTAKSGSSVMGEYGELGTESYKLTVSDGIMRILGGNQRGCVYGVYDFLEKYVGWRFLGDDVEYLYDAEEIVINDVDDSHTPSFSYRATTIGKNDYNNFPKIRQNCFNTTKYAHAPDFGYGFGSTFYHAHTFSYQVEPGTQGSDPYGSQPCLTNPEVKQTIINSMFSLINERLNPPYNTRIGYDMVQIGCSMNDNTFFCKCKDCMAVIRSTSFSDLYLGFVNDAAAAVAEKYPGIIVNTAIYFAARKPPVETVPADNVSIYYCVQGCNQHTIAGGGCEGYSTTLGTENVTEKAQLEAWTEICDRIYVWHYSTTFFSVLGPCPNVYELYDDVTYCANLDGVVGFYGEGSYTNNFENLKAYIFGRLMYNADINEEEFYAMIDEYITIVYGEESAPYIRQYLDMHQQSGDAVDGCFINNYHYPLDMMDVTYLKKNYGIMQELFDKAVRYAEDAATEKKISMLRLHMEFMGLSATYDEAYVNGDAKSRAKYEADYKWLVDYYRECGFGEDRIGTTCPPDYDLSENPMFKFIPGITLLSKEGRA